MIICQYCGASVHGNVCEYCDMPVNNSAPPKVIYPEKNKSVSYLPIIKNRKKFIRAVVAGAVSVFAVGFTVMCIAINHSPERTYIPYSPEYAVEYHEEPPVYNEAVPVYNEINIASEAGVFYSGTYHIGIDIPEGTYLFVSDFSNGYGEEGIYSDSDCQEQISWQDTKFNGTRIAKLSGNNYVDFSNAIAYNLDMHPEIVNNPYEHEGMFIVGRDIPAGTYTLKPYGEDAENAEWFLYSDLCLLGPMLKNYGYIGEYSELLGFNDEITLEDGEIFKLNHCIIE